MGLGKLRTCPPITSRILRRRLERQDKQNLVCGNHLCRSAERSRPAQTVRETSPASMHHRTVAGCILGTLVCPRCDEHGPGLFGGGGEEIPENSFNKIGRNVAFQAPEKTYKNLTKKVFQEVFNASAPHSPRVSRRCAYMHMYMYRCTMSTLDQHQGRSPLPIPWGRSRLIR